MAKEIITHKLLMKCLFYIRDFNVHTTSLPRKPQKFGDEIRPEKSGKFHEMTRRVSCIREIYYLVQTTRQLCRINHASYKHFMLRMDFQ